MEEQNFLLACYKGYYARLQYRVDTKKWIGRVLDAKDLLVFEGDDLEDALSTFHKGIKEYKSIGGAGPSQSHAQVINMIRYGIEERPFMETAQQFLDEEIPK